MTDREVDRQFIKDINADPAVITKSEKERRRLFLMNQKRLLLEQMEDIDKIIEKLDRGE